MIIYKIVNDINNKVYIGQTIRTLEDRIRGYKNELQRNPQSRPIISAMSKYGFENFHFYILEDNIFSKEVLDEKEKYYISQYKSLITQNGYNVELGGNSVGKHSEETKRKIGEAQKGEKNHMFGKKGELNSTSKKVIELTTGRIFGSASLAAEELKANFSHVCAVARGTRGSHKGYVFRYLDEQGNVINPPNATYIRSLQIRDKILPQFQYLFQANIVPSSKEKV